MTQKHEIVWGGILLLLLFVTAAITFSAYATKVETIYQPDCTIVYAASSAPKECP